MPKVLLLVLGTIAGASALAQDELVRIDRAQIDFVADGKEYSPQFILLPLHWDVSHRRVSAIAELRLEFPRSENWPNATEPYMLFMTRIGNAYEIVLNDTLLATAGQVQTPGGRWSAKHPVAIRFPSSLITDRNQLRIRLRADAGRRAGVSPIVVGPARVIEPLRDRAEFFRVLPAQAAAVFSIVVASFCFLLWLQQRDPLYAWASIGEAVWALIVADVVLETSPVRWPAWGLLLVMLRAIWIWALYVVVEQVFGARPKLERRTIGVATLGVLLCVVTTIAIRSPAPLEAWRIVNWSLWMLLTLRLMADTWRHISSERVLLVLALISLSGAGWHDALAQGIYSSQFGDSNWVRYVGALLGLTVMWIVSNRFRSARIEAVQLNASLAQRVEQKERELRQSFERLSEVEQSRAVIAERERILRDMHDGVGANLATAMRQLESGTAPTNEVAATLRESLDHLKLSIDAMNLPTGDVNALLASLRYRLQPRIESAGLALQWQVDLLPFWSQGTDRAMRHLQFLLLEAISNVLQHAMARTMTLCAHADDARLQIELRDDGIGLRGAAGRGMHSMRERAAIIHATLVVESVSPGTCVRIVLDHRTT